MPIRSFNPPMRTLMGPGPSDVHPRVLAAMARPTIGHLDPAFVGMMDEVKGMLQYAFQTRNHLTMPVSAPGSAGMETCFVNLVEPGDKVVVCINGVFGGRMKENVDRLGGVPILVEDAWGDPVDPNKLEDALRSHGCVFQPSRTPDLMMADTLGASRRKQVSYLPDCPPWGKAEADLRIDSRVVSSMRWALWINRSRMASLIRPPPRYSCQSATGSCEVAIVELAP